MQSRRLQALLLLLAAALLAVLLINWLNDDGVELTADEPQVVSVSELEGFAEDAGHPIYWLGERPDTEYELTETEDGRIYVRYLPAGTETDDEGRFLTVGTYPVPDAAAALNRTAREDRSKEVARSDRGGVVLIDRDEGANTHLAYPDEGIQIEIFSPVPGQAVRLAARDRVIPVS